jgi:hypothetical protein
MGREYQELPQLAVPKYSVLDQQLEYLKDYIIVTQLFIYAHRCPQTPLLAQAPRLRCGQSITPAS